MLRQIVSNTIDAMLSLMLLNLSYASVFVADTLLYAVTFGPVILTFDVKHLQRTACEVMKLCTKFERNRSIRGGSSYTDFRV